MTDRVIEIVRKRNSLAIQKRVAWRARYHILTASIRQAKQEVRSRPCDHTAKIELEGLQSLAQIMMAERGLITLDLRDTAYKWV